MVGAAGAAGAAAAAELQATHWRHRGRTGAGGVTGYTVAALVEDWRRCAAAPAEDREPADMEGARSRSHGPAAERPALGLEESEWEWNLITSESASLRNSEYIYIYNIS